MNRDIFPARVQQLQWIGKSNWYAYAKENAIFRVSAKKGTEELFFNLDQLNAGMQANGLDSLKKLPALNFAQEGRILFTLGNKYFRYDLKTSLLIKINEVPDTAENIDYKSETGNIAFTIANNLYLASNGETKQVTSDADRGIVNGQTVHRNEFGIKKGIFWSPDGNKLAFFRKDETMVTDYPLVDISKRIAAVENTKYPMAGMMSEEVTLGIFDLATSQTVFMKTGKPADQYLTSVTWDPDGKSIYIALLNREQNYLKLNQYDTQTGELVKTLFEEKNSKYVEPENPLYFLPGKPDQFIWVSERDGFDHLYLYNTNGNLIRQLTKGSWVVNNLIGLFGENTIFYLGTQESPLQQNIYSVNTETGLAKRISPDHGTHSALISGDGKFSIDIFSNTEKSREYKLLDNTGKSIRTFQEDNQPLKDYKLGEMTIFKLKSEDSADLYCRMIKPIDFDSSKKYPVIIYVYGGPHAQETTDSWLGGAGFVLNYFAQQGFLVFTLDNHGSANRGRDFEQAIHRNLGTLEVRDQMIGVNYLKSLSFVDQNRIGVDGWSYGGFMAISLMLKNPGVFAAGVAGGSVIDWQYYEVMYGERYMDTPLENPDGYKNANLIAFADKLQGHLLIIHGTMDPTVVWQNNLLFIQEAVSKGKFPDYFVYPGHGHGVGGNDRDHVNELIFNYFKENL